MSRVPPDGLYEMFITLGLKAQITTLPEELVITRALESPEAADRFALHLSKQIERVIQSIPKEKRVEFGAALAAKIIDLVGSEIGNVALSPEVPATPPMILHGIARRRLDGEVEKIPDPLIPLLDTTLLTNARDEPRIGSQLKAEIASSESVNVIMAFIRRSGLRELLPSIKALLRDDKPVRFLTTTFTGTTEKAALDELTSLGAEVRVSYTTDSSRLHAKAWIFNRPSGFSTAYVGSSNLTATAQGPGLEWNVRVSEARNPNVVQKMSAVFESYWENPDFRDYDPGEFAERTQQSLDDGPRIFLSPVAVSPLPFQERLLDELAASRLMGHHQNLLVSATGTGKTVMAALDYASLADSLDRSRLLFVAHRKEILDQSQATFRHVLRDHNFGEQWIRGMRPTYFEHVFASVQSLNTADLENINPDHFDVVIIDEFHHAAANSYERLLNHLRPIELLGLTATPERTDGLPILQWFGDRIAAELRLWDAIDQQYLVPFCYFGIHDGTDLRDVPWRRGRGYEASSLTNLYTATDAWALFVLQEFIDRIDDLSDTRALGFCVGVNHAVHMAKVFNAHGVAAAAVSGSTAAADRDAALKKLASGELKIVFSVDLFNEGVDLPAVNTLLFMRPTESATLYLQQLGRGLRRSKGKQSCLVLDFVGQHRREFRFDRPMRALLGGTRKDLQKQLSEGFPLLPSGCTFDLDQKSAEIILESLKSALPSTWKNKVEELRSLHHSQDITSIAGFLEASGLDLDDIYTNNHSWSDLLEDADLPTLPSGNCEVTLRRALGRLLHVDDPFRLGAYRRLFESSIDNAKPTFASERDRRLARMLTAQLMESVPRNVLPKAADIENALKLLGDHPQVCSEGIELMSLLERSVDRSYQNLSGRPENPLQVHGRYTRSEILAAFDHGSGARTTNWQAGVLDVPEELVDLFAITLDKTSGSFSPTTRYRDYAISPSIIHWESQSVTRSTSTTGQRYQRHESLGREVILFARLRVDSRAFWCLGPAVYQSHVGEMPMAINWKLKVPLPGDLFADFAIAVA